MRHNTKGRSRLMFRPINGSFAGSQCRRVGNNISRIDDTASVGGSPRDGHSVVQRQHVQCPSTKIQSSKRREIEIYEKGEHERVLDDDYYQYIMKRWNLSRTSRERRETLGDMGKNKNKEDSVCYWHVSSFMICFGPSLIDYLLTFAAILPTGHAHWFCNFLHFSFFFFSL